MMELKVECDCGQRYKFDVEPVNGRMPFTVNCPICGLDGTEKANLLLQQRAAGSVAASPITPIPAPITPIEETPAIPPAIAPAPTAPSSAAPRLRVNIPTHSPSQGAPPPPLTPPPIAAPLGAGRMRATATDPGEPEKKPNFWMGILGAFLGSLVGGAAYYLILTVFGLKSLFSLGMASLVLLIFIWIGSSFLTLGVGYLAGAGAAFLGKGEGSKELGGIAAIFALAGIIGAQYFIALTWWHQAKQIGTDAVYSMSVDTAKEAVAAVPTGSDSEIRGYLAQQGSDDDDAVNSNSITADQIKQFREVELPEYRGLASGQITKEQFLAKNGKDKIDATQADEQKDDDSDEGTFKAIFLALLLRKTNIIMLIAAAGLAYRISANA